MRYNLEDLQWMKSGVVTYDNGIPISQISVLGKFKFWFHIIAISNLINNTSLVVLFRKGS
jgi:hypothetical protein